MSDIMQRPNDTVATVAADSLISLAISKDVDMERLKELIDLRNKEMDRQAKLLFDRNFADMQREFKPVCKKNTVADKEGKIAYRYASLDDILAVYQPIISGHGFGYRFEQEERPGNITRIVCVVSGYGHETRSFSDVPLPEMTRMTNAVQQRGSAITYAKRYAFCNAFGVVLADDDDDGRGASDTVVKYAESTPMAAPSTQVDMSEEEQKRHDEIKTLRGKLFSIALDNNFTDEEKQTLKAKANIGRANTEGYKKYVISLIAEATEKIAKKAGSTTAAVEVSATAPEATAPSEEVKTSIGEPVNPAVAKMFSSLKKEFDAPDKTGAPVDPEKDLF